MKTGRTEQMEAMQSGPARAEETASTLGPSIRITGQIHAAEEIVIKGTFQGDLNTSNRVVLTEKSSVKGTIQSRDIEIYGCFEGEAKASQKLTLHATGNLNGRIETPRLVIREGAHFTGNASMENLQRS